MKNKKYVSVVIGLQLFFFTSYCFANEQYCYSKKDNGRIIKRLAELVGCKNKVKNRDRALKEVYDAVKGYKYRELVRKDKLSEINRALEKSIKEVEMYKGKLKTAITLIIVISSIAALGIAGTVIYVNVKK